MAFIGSETRVLIIRVSGQQWLQYVPGCVKVRQVAPLTPLIRIGDRSECFGQTSTSGTRKDMSTYVTVANMNDANCIFGESGTHLAEMFKDGASRAILSRISFRPQFRGRLKERLFVQQSYHSPSSFPVRALSSFVVFPNGGHIGIRSCAIASVSKQRVLNIPVRIRIKIRQLVILSHKHASCRIVPYHKSWFHKAVPPNACRLGSLYVYNRSLP